MSWPSGAGTEEDSIGRSSLPKRDSRLDDETGDFDPVAKYADGSEGQDKLDEDWSVNVEFGCVRLCVVASCSTALRCTGSSTSRRETYSCGGKCEF